jgi:hypothetical protein
MYRRAGSSMSSVASEMSAISAVSTPTGQTHLRLNESLMGSSRPRVMHASCRVASEVRLRRRAVVSVSPKAHGGCVIGIQKKKRARSETHDHARFP